MEDNSIKTGKAAGKGKKNKGIQGEPSGRSLKGCPSIKFLGLLEETSTPCYTHMKIEEALSAAWALLDFNDMVLDSGLTDAGFEGEPFTWSNKRVWRRLDRVLYSQEWAELFNSTRVSHLPRRLSDHHPLLISATRTEDKVPSSFIFQHMWIMHPNFQEMIKQS
ncbi:hypothetical protein Sango_2690000 [Sesamum angolense]|uniref:Uncharacterized protein n=1 Tax=Sesamum angolense TaxID=2727404 RepID=A0AAE1W2Q3_9LAMI|nr:hypothetical protein Sango_2690000 [Sesamum angolense]